VLLVFELFLTALGVATLIRGRIDVFGHWIVEGLPARIMGLLFTMPVTITMMLGFQRGYALAKAGRQFSIDDYQDLTLTELALFGIALVLSGILSLFVARKPPKPVNVEEEWKNVRQYGAVDEDDEATRVTYRGLR
jgi:hypothetical protein